jgi:RNA binding exosome subunit
VTEAKPVRYHWIRLRTVAHPTEAIAKVQVALRFASGLDEATFPAALKDTPMESHHGLPSHILEVALEKSRHVRDLLQRVFDLPDVLDRLRATLEARTDDDGVFYLRVDKQAAYAGRLELTDGEDCVQLRLKLETYPAGRAAAIVGLKQLVDAGKP